MTKRAIGADMAVAHDGIAGAHDAEVVLSRRLLQQHQAGKRQQPDANDFEDAADVGDVLNEHSQQESRFRLPPEPDRVETSTDRECERGTSR